MFDSSSFANFKIHFTRQRVGSEVIAEELKGEINSATMGEGMSSASEVVSQPTLNGSAANGKVNMNMLNLNQEDFPDVCIKCEWCVKSIRDAIAAHTATQIKDADIAQSFVDSAMMELMKFL